MSEPLWLVVFSDLDPIDWTMVDEPWRVGMLHWLLESCLKPGFRHCFALRQDSTPGSWLLLNPHSGKIDVIVVNDHYLDLLADLAALNLCTLQAVQECRPRTIHFRAAFTCVAVIKHLLGIGGLALTPWQLYRHLQPAKGIATMGGFMGGGGGGDPPAVDTSAMDAARAAAEKDKADLKAKNEASLRAIRARTGGGGGRTSLLAFAGEGGVGPRDKLGV